MSINSSFWKNKRVLITGHNGFKGSWLCLWLKMMESDIYGFSLPPKTSPNLLHILNLNNDINSVLGDIRDFEAISKLVKEVQPEIVIHMAAQPLVRYSYLNTVETYSTNVMGTVNLLEALRTSNKTKVFINVTTDKCYENKEWNWGYREIDRLGGHDPYSNSKACSELVTSSFRDSFFYKKSSIAIASARAGNVIGGGDWSQDRLIPDILKAIRDGKNIKIRNPNATRPWQHVLEPLSGYLLLAQSLFNGDSFARGSWNFGPLDDGIKPVKYVVDYLLNKMETEISWEFHDDPQKHEAQLLKLDISKAQCILGWHPKMTLEEALISIQEWEMGFKKECDMREISSAQIKEYCSRKEII